MKNLKYAAVLILASLSGLISYAQIPGAKIPPRQDDHFQRWLVVNRIDFDEKLNRPMVVADSPELYDGGRYGESSGLVTALVNGLKSGKYLAYHPDSLNKSLTWADVQERVENWGDTPVDVWEEPLDDDPYLIDDDFPEGEDDPFYMEDDLDPVAIETAEMDLSAYETVIEFIEERIFDKNRSDMVYNIKYIRLVWVDPGESLPDKNFICLKYSDVLETLEDTQWKNRFNDAECRNMREVFENRMFHSYISTIPGRSIRTLAQSDYRRQELVDFEHHLWSY